MHVEVEWAEGGIEPCGGVIVGELCWCECAFEVSGAPDVFAYLCSAYVDDVVGLCGGAYDGNGVASSEA